MLKDVSGKEIKPNNLVWDLFNDEVAEVLEVLETENKIRIQYVGEENLKNAEILECNPETVEIVLNLI